MRKISTLMSIIFIFFSCNEQIEELDSKNSTPEISTKHVSDIGKRSAKSGGNFIKDNGSSIYERGVVLSRYPEPTLENFEIKRKNGSGTSDFDVNIDSLFSGTIYYVRAYAINNEGVGYGVFQSFSTLEGEFKLDYISGDKQQFGGGMPYPMVFKIINITDSIYVSNSSYKGFKIQATSSSSTYKVDFTEGIVGSCENCIQGYWYSDIENRDGVYEPIGIDVKLFKHDSIIDTYKLTQFVD